MIEALLKCKPTHRFIPFLQGGGVILESNVRVENQDRAQRSIHDGVKGSGSEGGNGKRNQANGNESVWWY